MDATSPSPTPRDDATARLHVEAAAGPAIVEIAARIDGPWANRPVRIVVPESDDARAWADGLATLLGAVRVHELEEGPADPTLPTFEEPSVQARRVAGVWAAADVGPGVVVGTVAAWARTTVPSRVLLDRRVDLSVGQVVDRDDVVARLVDAGYRRVPLVTDPGDLAVRGGIVDVHPPTAEAGVRIEWFGDEIESMRTFDVHTQRSLEPIASVGLGLVRENLVTDPAGFRARVAAAADALDLPSRLVRDVVAQVERSDPETPWAAIGPLLHAAAEPVFAHVPEGAVWVVVDPARTLARHRQVVRVLEAAVERARAVQGFAAPAAAYTAPPASCEALVTRAQVAVGIGDETGRARLAVEVASTQHLVADLARVRRGEGALAQVLAKARPFGPATRTIVAVSSRRRLEDFVRIVGPEFPVCVHADEKARGLAAYEPGVHAVVGRFAETCAVPAHGLVVVGHRDLFGDHVARGSPRRRTNLARLGRLRAGDHVVHRLHGIGRFEGLVRLTLRGTTEEFARIVYAGGDKLYLPVLRIGEIEPYVGAGEKPPPLDRLGGQTFARRKRKVEADVAGLAEALLRLYADRAARTRPAYPEPDAHDAAFAASFPFEETPDQLAAIDAVHADLSAPRPMDRLVCGDVGFGKTEVALRAIFRVAASGRQVALLAPTTVLARQHERTLEARLEPFGLTVAGLHRFVPAPRRRRILEELREGSVDVVVGTHRLLQKDVRFRRLGLVVIDEEQRFGVRHKERLAMLRTDVDVLSLSATPIPRTLHMALSGLRDVSLLSTPPPDRLAVATSLAREDDRLVADAIRTEVARGGQVFFVVPRILDLEPWRVRLADVVPEVSVAVAHGKMPARRLEAAMLDFVEGRADVLLCTTIAENGLDIPRANTLIVAGAHRFGLAQLHQLRGRVGRSHVRARAYLLVPNLAGLSAEALARLSAVVDHSDLGAGFDIARRDLELRGAGELLGKRQSGSIARIGFSAYAHLLEEAVARLDGRVLPDEATPEVAADVSAYLPDAYLPDPVLRLEFYRALADARGIADVDEVALAMEDRFGRPPPEAVAFFELSKWQALGRTLGVESVEVRGATLAVRCPPGPATARFAEAPWTSRPDGLVRATLRHRGDARLREVTALLAAAAATAAG
ncbi:MAG: transcription-repair coupling factor [Deltaproteobacteria bacterium]|nr:MAG: transcription-repair coupling factor [Deltaproteobacteria bacterium]